MESQLHMNTFIILLKQEHLTDILVPMVSLVVPLGKSLSFEFCSNNLWMKCSLHVKDVCQLVPSVDAAAGRDIRTLMMSLDSAVN